MKRLTAAALGLALGFAAFSQDRTTWYPGTLTRANTGITPLNGYFALPSFTTATLPNPAVAGIPVFDTTTSTVKVFKGEGWVEITDADSLAAYLPLAGGTLTGTLTLDNVGLTFQNLAGGGPTLVGAGGGTSSTVTVPNLVGTLALKDQAQTFSGTQTFENGIIIKPYTQYLAWEHNDKGTLSYVSLYPPDTTTNYNLYLPAANGTLAALSGLNTWTDAQLIDGSFDTSQLTVQGNATQTYPIVTVENSTGTDVFTVGNTGAVVAGGYVSSGGYISASTYVNSQRFLGNSGATTIFDGYDYASADNAFEFGNGTQKSTASSGSSAWVQLRPTWEQSGTAAATDLLIDRTSATTGSGAQYFIEGKDDGTKYFSVSSIGAIVGTSLNATTQNTLSLQASMDTVTAGKSIVEVGNNTNIRQTSGTQALLNVMGNVGAPTGNMDGTYRGVSILPVYNQTSTGGTSEASNTDLFINRTEVAVGSGPQLLLDAQVAGTSKFSVSRTGLTTIANAGSIFLRDGTTASDSGLKTVGGVFMIRRGDDSNYNDLAASGITGTGFVESQYAGGAQGIINARGGDTTGIGLPSNGQVYFSDTTDGRDATPDAGIKRGGAAATVKITDGSTGYGTLSAGNVDIAGGGYLQFGSNANSYFYMKDGSNNVTTRVVPGGYWLGSGGTIKWTDNVDARAGTQDVGLTRDAAATLKITDGAAGSGALLANSLYIGKASVTPSIWANGAYTYHRQQIHAFVDESGGFNPAGNRGIAAPKIWLPSGGQYAFGSNTSYDGVIDTALVRSASAQVKITDGATGIGGLTAGNATLTETLGAEMVTNGTFTGGLTGWSYGAAWQYGTNNAQKFQDGTTTLNQSTVVPTVGKLYKVVYTISGFSGTYAQVAFGGTIGAQILGDGTYTEYFLARTTGYLYFTPTNTNRMTVDDVSVKEVVDGSGQLSATRVAVEDLVIGPNHLDPSLRAHIVAQGLGSANTNVSFLDGDMNSYVNLNAYNMTLGNGLNAAYVNLGGNTTLYALNKVVGTASDGVFAFSSTTSASGTKDVAIARTGAAGLKITDGSTGLGVLQTKWLTLTSGHSGDMQIYAKTAGGAGILVNNNFQVQDDKQIGFSAAGAASAPTSGIAQASSGTLLITDGSTGVGALETAREVEANTAGSGTPNALAATESWKVLTNEGATALNYHTLPAADAGLSFTFYVQDADGIRITPASGDSIRVGATGGTVDKYLQDTTIGDSVTLAAINATEWVAVSSVGTGWTAEP